jgi:hypothetical protein
VKNVDAFNRACRLGRVSDAQKNGRVWSCTITAWNERAPALRPRGLPAHVPSPRNASPVGGGVSPTILAELGARRAS